MEPRLSTAVALKTNSIHTADFNSGFVDVQQWVGQALAILSSAALTGTTPTFAIRLEQSKDGSTGITDVPAGAFTQISDAGASLQSLPIDIDKCDRFIRVTGVEGGTVTGGSIAVVMVGMQQQEP